MLLEEAERLIIKSKMKRRLYHLEIVSFKLQNNDISFEEKRNYIDFQIESCMNYYTTMLPSSLRHKE